MKVVKMQKKATRLNTSQKHLHNTQYKENYIRCTSSFTYKRNLVFLVWNKESNLSSIYLPFHASKKASRFSTSLHFTYTSLQKDVNFSGEIFLDEISENLEIFLKNYVRRIRYFCKSQKTRFPQGMIFSWVQTSNLSIILNP